MPSPAILFWGMLFSAVGAGYFVYGKRQALFAPLLCGVALIVVPWFVASTWWLVIIGLALMAVPWFIRR